MWCSLHGHDALLQFEQDRMYLRCVSAAASTGLEPARRARRRINLNRRRRHAPADERAARHVGSEHRYASINAQVGID
jgi:hypothetical protein